MRRDDLFNAIGMVDDELLARCEKHRTSFIANTEAPKTSLHLKRALFLAAIIALMALLMGSAIVTLVKMRVKNVTLYVPSTETAGFDILPSEETVAPHIVYEGEVVHFDEVQDVFIQLGTYYPQQIPEGYTMTFVSGDAPLQNQVIHYENDAGDMIKYWIYVGDSASSIEIYGIEDKLDVDINGQPGILYKQAGGSRMLIWVNEKQGYGFALSVNDPSVDILAMAESTGEGEMLTATRSDVTLKALEELGDFVPEYLPDGFEELAVQGSPLSEGSNWYSYVRKWYVNKAENTNIYFEYETYKIITEDGYSDDAKTVCSFFMPKNRDGELLAETVEINGMFGYFSRTDVVWADPEKHMVYHLHSKHITIEELLNTARSIVPNQ